MKKLQKLIESSYFQNTILAIIVINSVILGLQTSETIVSHTGRLLEILDYICLGIFIVELVLKLIVYRLKFFTDGWNWFDFIIILCSLVSGLSFLSVMRVFRIFRVFRSLKALKGLKAMRLVSRLDKLRLIIGAIGKSIPGISWTAVLLLLIYYIFALIGVTLFGSAFPDWFGNIGKAIYTLFQVMTLESWSMGISRPVMEVYSWAWVYFVPFVLISAFIMMNVVVGIVVNSISEVQEQLAKEKALQHAAKHPNMIEDESAEEVPENVPAESISMTADDKEMLKAELAALREQINKIESMIS